MPKIGKISLSKPTLIILSAIVIIAIVVFSLRILTPEDDWLCENGQWIRHGNPYDEMPMMDCPKNN